jgi:carbonic anhydrase/acetyltransferase-like protein (isoleucine patch superfamily)
MGIVQFGLIFSLGNNATILDEAEVGDFCIIGANAMVSQGMKIPDRSFVVGVPAAIKWEISAQQIARIELGVLAYTKLAQEYNEQGF